MITHNDIIADMHTHTVFSKHAFSTLQENIEAACKMGMRYMVSCDHYFNDGTEIEKKNEINRILYIAQRANPNPQNVYVINSVECNLEQPMRQSLKERLNSGYIKYRPVGLHSWFLPREERSLHEILMDFCEEQKKYNYNVFVHIERELDRIAHGRYGKTMHPELMPFFEEIVDYAKRNHVWLEVNEASLTQDNCGNRERMLAWLSLARENGNPIVLGSDAHFSAEVGRFSNTVDILNSIDYPKELIMNCNKEQIETMLSL